jgi:hypothetical protein
MEPLLATTMKWQFNVFILFDPRKGQGVADVMSIFNVWIYYSFRVHELYLTLYAYVGECNVKK